MNSIKRLLGIRIPDTVGGRVVGAFVECVAALLLYPAIKSMEMEIDKKLEKTESRKEDK